MRTRSKINEKSKFLSKIIVPNSKKEKKNKKFSKF